MGLQSMTGFGAGESENDNFSVSVEIKSVNHRFRDIRFRMSNHFNKIELDLRKQLEQRFKRGSFDIYVNYKRSEQTNKEFNIDESKVKVFLDLVKQFNLPNSSFNPVDFLRNEFSAEVDETIYDELAELVKEAFTKALDSLELCRNEEGEKLKSVLQEHRQAYENLFVTLEPRTDAYKQGIKERLQKSFEQADLSNNIDEPRFLQEVIYYLEKLDVHEELNRIKSHLSKFDAILQKGGEVGRQLDFLFQELNRETNTIGSKSGDQEISSTVVEMKVQLEKLREQALNLV